MGTRMKPPPTPTRVPNAPTATPTSSSVISAIGHRRFSGARCQVLRCISVALADRPHRGTWHLEPGATKTRPRVFVEIPAAGVLDQGDALTAIVDAFGTGRGPGAHAADFDRARLVEGSGLGREQAKLLERADGAEVQV